MCSLKRRFTTAKPPGVSMCVRVCVFVCLCVCVSVSVDNRRSSYPPQLCVYVCVCLFVCICLSVSVSVSVSVEERRKERWKKVEWGEDLGTRGEREGAKKWEFVCWKQRGARATPPCRTCVCARAHSRERKRAHTHIHTHTHTHTHTPQTWSECLCRAL